MRTKLKVFFACNRLSWLYSEGGEPTKLVVFDVSDSERSAKCVVCWTVSACLHVSGHEVMYRSLFVLVWHSTQVEDSQPFCCFAKRPDCGLADQKGKENVRNSKPQV